MSKQLSILGIIPARGGSKGIPKKNLRLFCGVPLVARAVHQALSARRLTRTIVSTDSEEIAHCARAAGGDVPFLRPASLAEDATPTVEAVLHAIEQLAARGEHYDAVCLLQATYPFRTSTMIDGGIDAFEKSGADTVISVLEVPHHFNPHWVFQEDATGTLKIATGEPRLITRRQDLPRAYHRDGALYISKVSTVQNSRSLVGGCVFPYHNRADCYVNLDTPDDWERGESLAKGLMLTGAFSDRGV